MGAMWRLTNPKDCFLLMVLSPDVHYAEIFANTCKYAIGFYSWIGDCFIFPFPSFGNCW